MGSGHLVPTPGTSPGSPALWTLTLRADVLEDEVEVLPTDAGRLDKLLLRHAAQLRAADVEVAEGDAVGIQLVLVTAELEPFPDMALGPVLRVDGRPVGVTGYARREGCEGQPPPGRPLKGPPKEAPVMLTPPSLDCELKEPLALWCSAGAQLATPLQKPEETGSYQWTL